MRKYVGHGERNHRRIAKQAMPNLTGPVHHVNGDGTDNRPENLVACADQLSHEALEHRPELLAQAEWTGQSGASVRYFKLPRRAGFKWCLRCLRQRRLKNFGKAGKRSARAECRECRAEAQAAVYVPHPMTFDRHPTHLHPERMQGERNPAAKLTAEQVAEIRRLKGQMSQTELGRQFGVSQSEISLIHLGKHWA